MHKDIPKTKEIRKFRTGGKIQQRNDKMDKMSIPLNANRKKLYHQIKEIDRSQTCPFLVRIFYAINDQNHYKDGDKLPLQRQIRLHLWMNSTLKQITQMLRAMHPPMRTKQKFFFWKLIFNNQKKQYQKVQLGWVYPSKRYDKIQQKALCHTKFNIGDMLDVSVTFK